MIATGSVPAVAFQTATERSKTEIPLGIDVEVVEISKEPRPFGPRFGTLVHAILATIELNADLEQLKKASELQGRILATSDEVSAASEAVLDAIQHPLMKRAEAAAKVGTCYRELPLTMRMPDGILVEGVADLVFSEHEYWIAVDFKTDIDVTSSRVRYERQLSIYAAAVRETTGSDCRAYLFRI